MPFEPSPSWTYPLLLFNCLMLGFCLGRDSAGSPHDRALLFGAACSAVSIILLLLSDRRLWQRLYE